MGKVTVGQRGLMKPADISDEEEIFRSAVLVGPPSSAGDPLFRPASVTGNIVAAISLELVNSVDNQYVCHGKSLEELTTEEGGAVREEEECES